MPSPVGAGLRPGWGFSQVVVCTTKENVRKGLRRVLSAVSPDKAARFVGDSHYPIGARCIFCSGGKP